MPRCAFWHLSGSLSFLGQWYGKYFCQFQVLEKQVSKQKPTLKRFDKGNEAPMSLYFRSFQSSGVVGKTLSCRASSFPLILCTSSSAAQRMLSSSGAERMFPCCYGWANHFWFTPCWCLLNLEASNVASLGGLSLLQRYPFVYLASGPGSETDESG